MYCLNGRNLAAGFFAFPAQYSSVVTDALSNIHHLEIRSESSVSFQRFCLRIRSTSFSRAHSLRTWAMISPTYSLLVTAFQVTAASSSRRSCSASVTTTELPYDSQSGAVLLQQVLGIEVHILAPLRKWRLSNSKQGLGVTGTGSV